MPVKKFTRLAHRPIILIAALMAFSFLEFGMVSGAQFRINSVQITNADVRITWNALGGSNYVVQSATALSPSNTFFDVSPLIFVPGSGTVQSTNYTHLNGMLNSSSRFYRIKSLPGPILQIQPTNAVIGPGMTNRCNVVLINPDGSSQDVTSGAQLTSLNPSAAEVIGKTNGFALVRGNSNGVAPLQGIFQGITNNVNLTVGQLINLSTVPSLSQFSGYVKGAPTYVTVVGTFANGQSNNVTLASNLEGGAAGVTRVDYNVAANVANSFALVTGQSAARDVLRFDAGGLHTPDIPTTWCKYVDGAVDPQFIQIKVGETQQVSVVGYVANGDEVDALADIDSLYYDTHIARTEKNANSLKIIGLATGYSGFNVYINNGSGCSILSVYGYLSVVGPPTITLHPMTQLVSPGTSVSFNVGASGSEPLYYQWRFNGIDIPGATATSYTNANPQTADAGNYSVLVTNFVGAVLSSNATLFVVSNQTYFEAAFEADLDGCVINNTYAPGGGLWHRSTGRGLQGGHSASNGLYYGKGEGPNGGGNYDAGNTAGAVLSPVINLAGVGAPIRLTFNYLLATEAFQNYDDARVEVSTNGGAFIGVAGNHANNVRLADSRTANVWTNAALDLSGFAGNQIQLRFLFQTVDQLTNQFEGWYVDDVRVSGAISIANDLFVNRISLSGRAAATFGSNVGASKEPNENAHAGFVGGKSVWWSWTAPATGSVTINTCGSGFDTLLAVYTGTAVNSLTPVVSNNDGSCSGTSTGQSQLQFNAIAGTAYQIAVDGVGGSSGSIKLIIEQ